MFTDFEKRFQEMSAEMTAEHESRCSEMRQGYEDRSQEMMTEHAQRVARMMREHEEEVEKMFCGDEEDDEPIFGTIGLDVLTTHTEVAALHNSATVTHQQHVNGHLQSMGQMNIQNHLNLIHHHL